MENFKRLTEERLQAARDAPPPKERPKPDGKPPDELTRRGVHPTSHRQTFDAFDVGRNPAMKLAFAAAQQLADGARRLLFLYGDPGLGKTHLATAAFIAWVNEHHTGRFWRVSDFVAFLQQHMSKGIREGYGDAAVEEVVRNYAEADCLIVFDDIGAEKETEWRQEQLLRILDTRYARMLPTLLTSNAAITRLDPRIRSRWRSGFVFCEGEDQR